jgi:hypothetical protein
MIDLEIVKPATARAARKAEHGTRAKQFLLRLPDGMHERIAREAAANHRSMNAEIVYHLQAMMAPVEAPNETSDPVPIGTWSTRRAETTMRRRKAPTCSNP